MTINLSHIRGIIWDLDGTLYRYNDYFIEACNVAAAQTIVELGLGMTYDDALFMARDSQKAHGHSFKLFGEMGVKYKDYHEPFHAKIDHLVVIKNHELRNTLSHIKIPMTVLTNASRDWALRTLSHLGMMDIFGDGNILALEDVGFKAKAYHTDGFEQALSKMNVNAQHALVVEDLSRNLVVAKQMGMTTALVHHQNQFPQNDNDTHVDYIFEDTIDIIKILKRPSYLS